jgi:hypothetical protein
MRSRATYVIGKGIIDAELASEPFRQRLKSTTQNREFATELLQSFAQFASARRNSEYRLQLLEHVSWNALQEADTLF